MKNTDKENINILFDTRVLTHKVYTGVENYVKIILDGISNKLHVIQAQPNTTNKYLSHLWFHLILSLKKTNIIFCPANIAPIYLSKSTKLVLTLHDLSFLTYSDTFSKIFRYYYNFLIPLNIKKANTIITVSNSSKNEIEKYFPEAIGKIIVIHNGLNPIFKQDKTIKKKNQILYVGSLNKRKNFSSVLNLFEKLNDNDFILILVGNFSSNFNLDDETKELITKAKLNKNIIFKQNITDEELVKLYNESKLFVYPSFYEGFGFPILEAMSCGTSVLTSNTTSLPEVGGDAVLYANPNDINDILHKTKQILYSDVLQQDMIDKGLIQSQKFTLDKMIEKHLEIFQRVYDEK